MNAKKRALRQLCFDIEYKYAALSLPSNLANLMKRVFSQELSLKNIILSIKRLVTPEEVWGIVINAYNEYGSEFILLMKKIQQNAKLASKSKKAFLIPGTNIEVEPQQASITFFALMAFALMSFIGIKTVDKFENIVSRNQRNKMSLQEVMKQVTTPKIPRK